MDSGKTKIWRGGLSALKRGRDGRTDAPELASELHATRVMPIERLLLADSALDPTRARSEPEPGTERVPKRKPRRWPYVLLGSVTLVAVVGLQVRQRRSRIADERPHAAQAEARANLPDVLLPAPRAAQAASAQPTPRLQKSTLPAPAPAPAPETLGKTAAGAARHRAISGRQLALERAAQPRAPQRKAARASGSFAPERAAGLERAAVDAVIAGDYPGAARLYRRLEQLNPNPAFAAAARILERRTH